MNNQIDENDSVITPENVKIEIRIVKNLILKHLAKKNLTVEGLHTNYSPYFAKTEAARFSNSGGPVAYIKFANAFHADGSAVSATDLIEAVGFTRDYLAFANEFLKTPDLPIEYVSGSHLIKVSTAALYDEAQKRYRLSTVVAEQTEPEEVPAS